MVSWVAGSDPVMAGYSPSLKKLAPGVIHFASPGTVDSNSITRILYAMPLGDAPKFPNRLSVSVPITFTSGDFSANPGKKLSVALFIVAATDLPPNKVPTPSEILAMGSKVAVYRANRYVTGPQTTTFEIAGPSAFAPNSKYWALIVPTALVDVNSAWNTTNDKPMAGITVNTFGRAISFWSNRTPGKPVITSPPSGTVAAPGTVLNFTYQPSDPDAVLPVDTAKSNLDLAGVRLLYRPVPTPENPQPDWSYLTYCRSTANQYSYTGVVLGQANVTADDRKMIENLGFPILCGSDDHTPLHALLPGGDWELVMQTADFGNPYPNLLNSPDNKSPGEWTMGNYPALNKSPFSDPIRITVPSQVPPPTPLYPTQSIAVLEEETVRLTWLYRNTHVTGGVPAPLPQAERTVQIRKANDPDWSTIFKGLSADPYVDLPPVLTNPAVDPPDLASWTFESGVVGGWALAPASAGGTDGSETLSVLTNAAEANTGTRSLRIVYTGAGSPGFWREFTPASTHDTFSLSGHLGVDSAKTGYIASIAWFDADDNEMAVGEEFSPFVFAGAPESGWTHQYLKFDLGFMRPAGGVYFVIYITAIGSYLAGAPSWLRLDDVIYEGSASDPLDDFTLEATTEYEWRVKVTDSDSIESTYSSPARFWVVPAEGSGAERPIPTETIEGATLGCGTHRVFVYRRGGKTRVGELMNLSHVDWNRKRDDISDAKVVVKDWGVDCGNLLASLQPWAYELVIFRDNGYRTERVWEGPITTLTYEVDSVTIDARDVMNYAYRRIIKQKMSDAADGDTVVNRAARVLRNALGPDDPNVLGYLVPITHTDDAREYRSTPAFSRTAFEEVDDMAANAGLDYTVVGRSILLWGTKHRIGTLPEFRDGDLGAPPIVSVYGMSFANFYSVSDGNGLHGDANRLDANGKDEVYGLVEMLSSTWATDTADDSGTYTQAGQQTVIESFAEYAERSIADRYPPPVVVRVPDNTTLNPDVALSIQQLVPGVVIPLRSTGTLRTVVASQKLDSITVTEEGGKETITLTMSPFSRDDAALGGEEVEV